MILLHLIELVNAAEKIFGSFQPFNLSTCRLSICRIVKALIESVQMYSCLCSYYVIDVLKYFEMILDCFKNTFVLCLVSCMQKAFVTCKLPASKDWCLVCDFKTIQVVLFTKVAQSRQEPQNVISTSSVPYSFKTTMWHRLRK